ncbi:MAG TPA: hypothetical protein VF403_28150, partial [Kofleriaceae bacterium]
MRSALIVTALLFAACHGSDSSTSAGSAGSPPTTPSAKLAPAAGSSSGSPSGSAAVAAAGSDATPTPAPPPEKRLPPPPVIEGHDFTSEGKLLLTVGACGDGPPPDGITAEEMTTHCADVKKAQDDYAASWVKPAREFFAA